VNGPHQGGWVQTPQGEDWFIHFQDKRAYGRVVHLQPMKWRDGWPLIGEDVGGAAGQPVASYRMPVVGKATAAPPTSDEFNGAALGLQWQWNANWQPSWYALGDGKLRLFGQPRDSNLWDVPSLLLQKLPAETFTVTTKMDASGLSEGGVAGLVMYGSDYAWLGTRRSDGVTRLALVSCYKADVKCHEQQEAGVDLPSPKVWLRMQVLAGGVTQFSYSLDGAKYTPIGAQFTAKMGRWVGAQMGLFSAGNAGHADIDYFRVTR